MKVSELKDEDEETMIHLFRITQSLIRVAIQKVDLALKELDRLEKDKQTRKIK